MSSHILLLFAEILPRFPSVFSEWFLSTFPDPQDWFSARLSYVRTTAVMSMVGFIVGLGDRHGENILFDAACGDAVHVDFSCLFNKGFILNFMFHNSFQYYPFLSFSGSYRSYFRVARTSPFPSDA